MRAPRNAPETCGRHKDDIEFDGDTPFWEGKMISIETNGLIHLAAAVLLGAAAFMSAGSGTAHAASKVVAHVDISDQRMEVSVNGRPTFEWKVSTARKGYVTPIGSYKPTRLEEMWYSKKYDNSPMPHSVFFHGGYAVHATNAVKRLGTPASHGCVRLHPNDAADFYELVQAFGSANTSIVITE
jgi:lipoprotein-anchoring transpeptidase ErfK/SrfK